MGHPDGAHTHGSGGSGLGTVVLVIVAAALLGPAVAAAVAELLHLLLIALAVLAGVAVAGVVALVAFRVSRGRQEAARVLYRVTPAPPRPAPLRSEPRPVIEAPRPRPTCTTTGTASTLRTWPPSSAGSFRKPCARPRVIPMPRGGDWQPGEASGWARGPPGPRHIGGD